MSQNDRYCHRNIVPLSFDPENTDDKAQLYQALKAIAKLSYGDTVELLIDRAVGQPIPRGLGSTRNLRRGTYDSIVAQITHRWIEKHHFTLAHEVSPDIFPNTPARQWRKILDERTDEGRLSLVLVPSTLSVVQRESQLEKVKQVIKLGQRFCLELDSSNHGHAIGVGGSLASSTPDPRIKFAGELAGSAAAFLFVFAGIAITAGIFLAYILPIIPFVYFAFALMGWILEIFEAVVAMPLWALAHLRIDGEGMPGQAAISGYQLLLMILLRPALIVIGLIGGYVIFSAAIFFFATLFNSATAITQSDIAANSIGAIGIFVYTIIFAFLTYNIALMCFKLVDDVPKGILRWMGAGVQPFSDSRGDPINGSREMVAGGAAAMIGLSRGIQSGATGASKANMRNKQRKQGIDPDDPVQKVQIIQPQPPGGGGTP
ncbi:hypothetical protein DS901_09040 [Loktanella sp. D2R18]|uniref:DotA/TraY family protein n=1 Tax=Rhodobacterales TaxID=204455 RepID=UPI000DE86182|nr:MULTISPECIES: DotA/TraY family protein [Rhodobacterales]MDO6591499.1 DotA/TraY family protein [Yoonia sp. 1_MG-2023]RBW43866.1 hypothetical protein DS901_09040 [Loktanella sp. D2R18]